MKGFYILYCTAVLCCTLGISDGVLALMKDGRPLKHYPCTSASLPAADRIILEAGIPIYSKEQLTAHLEDYLS